MKIDISKFSLPEALSNLNGKTSGTKLVGFITIVNANLAFLLSVIGAFYGVGDSVAIAGISSSLIISSMGLFAYGKKNGTKDTTEQQNI